HAAISREDSKRFLDWAFRRDFERNGPSIYRICRTTLEGWLRYKNDPDARVKARFAREARSLRDGYTAALWAMEHHLAGTNEPVAEKIRSLREQVESEFGLFARVMARALGPVMLWSARREERRLAAGHTYEPTTIIERRNWTWTAPLLPASPLAVLPAIEESSAS
ncbi:MAG: B12-binding domain-containing radical SAM protein, partial [Bryobacteraceae bacterium]